MQHCPAVLQRKTSIQCLEHTVSITAWPCGEPENLFLAQIFFSPSRVAFGVLMLQETKKIITVALQHCYTTNNIVRNLEHGYTTWSWSKWQKHGSDTADKIVVTHCTIYVWKKVENNHEGLEVYQKSCWHTSRHDGQQVGEMCSSVDIPSAGRDGRQVGQVRSSLPGGCHKKTIQ